ncbi:MAG: ABC transporter permease [Flavobacteriales bacterium]|nr:ABC transporter permease [Flavobacteriales bacterium]
MLKKLLFRNQDKKQLGIAAIGALLGMTFLITSAHFLYRINEFGEGSEVLGANILIVQRKVTSASTLNLSNNDFTAEEISEIQQQPFVEKVQAVKSNNFRVWLETNSDIVPPFKTDAFIMPRDFVVMLNTFMSSSGIAQISDEVATSIPFKLRISGPKGEEWLNARIIGFTNEISALLVPMEFMNYANLKYGENQDGKITQVIIKGKEGQFGSLEKYLNEKGLEPKKAQMIVGRLKSIISMLIFIILVVSIVAVISSVLVLLQYMHLLLSQNRYEVKTLLRIGYSPYYIARLFVQYFSIVFAVSLIAAFGLFFILKWWINKTLQIGGIYLNEDLSVIAVIILPISFLLFVGIGTLSARKNVMQLFNK